MASFFKIIFIIEIMEIPKIIAVVTTKNRPQLLEIALNSIASQKVKPYIKVLVSDSESVNKIKEKELALKHGFLYIENNSHEHNYAGSLNTSIDFLIERFFINESSDLNDFYFATLDDDDTWNENYLKEISKVLKPEIDIVVTGLWMDKGEKNFPLTIPDSLEMKTFFTKNPHIQGSNTFVRLSFLLKAGAFDENMSSTTDRDVFSRLFMLKPNYTIIKEYLVKVNAEDSRPRITNTFSIKLDGLTKFYAKYSGAFSVQDDLTFNDQIKRFGDMNINQHLQTLTINVPSTNLNEVTNTVSPILVGFILSNPIFAERLIPQLLMLSGLRKIVIFVNHPQVDLSLFEDDRIVLFTLNQVKELNKKGYYSSFIKNRKLKHKTITDISVARTILHQHVYDEALASDVIWILDDDMELNEVILEGKQFVKKPLNIQHYIQKYKHEYDVVVGAYSGDTPLPLLSSIRSQLLDYTYKALFNPRFFDLKIYLKPDYYYDLSTSEVGLETPLPFEGQSIDDVFSSKAFSRPLFKQSVELFPSNSRGGNTLIFNKEVLKIQNVSIEVDGVVGRRGDYFWILQLQQQRFRVIASHFSTHHNRISTPFNYDDELEKFEKDLIGSSFTKAYAMSNHPDHFYTNFKSLFLKRVIRFIKNYYRIIGLLSILPTNKYEETFKEIKLTHFVKYILLKLKKSKVKPAYLQLVSDQTELSKIQRVENIKLDLERLIKQQVNLLGIGNEGVVFTDSLNVYKVFFDENVDLSFLKTIAPKFSECKHLHTLSFALLGSSQMIIYNFIPNFEIYHGGYTNQFIKLINFFKSIGTVPTNIKKSNFIVANKVLYYIDYGQSFEPLTEAGLKKFIKRTYQLIRYHFVSEGQFKEIIYRSYQGTDNYINYQLNHFESLINPKSKEGIHDPIIKNFIQESNPKTLLDYGAGKCKIANSLSDSMRVSVYDSHRDQLVERAKPNVTILSEVKGIFDMVTCNLVLCVVDDQTAINILQTINSSLKIGHSAVISICNPFFNDVQRTELRKNIKSPHYETCCDYDKRTVSKTILHEFHRPYEFYARWFNQYGFEIEKIAQTEGFSFKSFNRVSNHMVFKLIKKSEINILPLTLMIKASIMDHDYLESQVKHIVSTLQVGFQFADVFLVLDDIAHSRTRAYANDNLEKTMSSLNLLLRNGWIKKVIRVSENLDLQHNISMRYFGEVSKCLYSDNGQPIFASLLGFEKVQTPFVFHTDLDILFHQKGYSFLKSFEEFRASSAISASLSAFHGSEMIEAKQGTRIEVRNSFIDLTRFKETLPWKNKVLDKQTYALPWHRAYDLRVESSQNLRFQSFDLFFIHPQNEKKLIPNFIQVVQDNLSLPHLPISQMPHEVNLSGTLSEWISSSQKEVIVFVRGFNTIPEKLNRLFDSLKMQTFQNFDIIYIDDASKNASAAYMKFLFQYDFWIQSKLKPLFNQFNVGSLANQVFALTHMVKNPNAIIINVDNDDALISPKAIERILEEYHQGADVTIGNLIRREKPVKEYQLIDFRWPWDRKGDNIWLHPKTFRKYLFDKAIPYLKDENGNYYQVNTDFAMMLPILYHAKQPRFIDDILYYFEPSNQNQNKSGLYDEKNVLAIKKKLLYRWKEIYEKDHHHHWR
jgi:glycosyltransferase involved in cell wall biosynthesis